MAYYLQSPYIKVPNAHFFLESEYTALPDFFRKNILDKHRSFDGDVLKVGEIICEIYLEAEKWHTDPEIDEEVYDKYHEAAFDLTKTLNLHNLLSYPSFERWAVKSQERLNKVAGLREQINPEASEVNNQIRSLADAFEQVANQLSEKTSGSLSESISSKPPSSSVSR